MATVSVLNVGIRNADSAKNIKIQDYAASAANEASIKSAMSELLTGGWLINSGGLPYTDCYKADITTVTDIFDDRDNLLEERTGGNDNE